MSILTIPFIHAILRAIHPTGFRRWDFWLNSLITPIYLPLMLMTLTIRLVQNSTSCGQFHIMREFRLCSKSHNAQYTSTKIKAKPVRTDNAMQEMLENSFLERPTVVRLQQRRGRYIGADSEE